MTDRQHIEGREATVLSAAFRHFTADLTNALDAARSIVTHNLMRGELLEEALRGALRSFIPSRFDLLSGQVVDPTTASRQQDLVIVDTESVSTLWRLGDVGVIPIEAVRGAIEVKTSLNAEQVRSAVRNVRSVKELLSRHPGEPRGIPGSHFGAIVAFDSSVSLMSLAKTYQEECSAIEDPQERCDALLVVGHGAVMPGHVADRSIVLEWWEDAAATGGSQVIISGGDDGALLVLYRLLQHLQQYQPPEFSLLNYGPAAAASGRWRYRLIGPDAVLTPTDG